MLVLVCAAQPTATRAKDLYSLYVEHFRGSAKPWRTDTVVLKWLRALDGLNTHDDSYRLSVSGGVTTALILPGSANAIGKLRLEVTKVKGYDSPMSKCRWTRCSHQTSSHSGTVSYFIVARESVLDQYDGV